MQYGWSFVSAWCCVLVLLIGAAMALPAAASPREPEEGFDYEVVAPVAGWPAVPGKITVVESFWYQCPQCNALLPLIEYWAKRMENRVHFVRVPLALRAELADQETLYHVLEELGEVERLHPAIFEAIHVDHVSLRTLDEMAEFLDGYGIPPEKFLAVARSPAVKARRAAAEALLAHYKIRSVPILVVDGRYVTSAARIGGTHADSLVATDWLVRLAEQERRAREGTR